MEDLRTDCIACLHALSFAAEAFRAARALACGIDPAPAIARRTGHVLREHLGFLGSNTSSAALNYVVFTGALAADQNLWKRYAFEGLKGCH
jgi:hypothetical protein